MVYIEWEIFLMAGRKLPLQLARASTSLEAAAAERGELGCERPTLCAIKRVKHLLLPLNFHFF